MNMGSRLLLRFAGILLFAAVAAWLIAGGHRGWTKTSVPRKVVDEVTGIEGVTYERRFVPGLDFLAAGALGALLLAGASFTLRKLASQTKTPETSI